MKTGFDQREGFRSESSCLEEVRAILGAINSDDWALSRVAELREQRERATFRIDWKTVEGHRQYSVTVRRADGTIERAARPSEEQGGNPPSLAFCGGYDPPRYAGPTTYTDADVFVGVGSPKGGAAAWTGCGECDPLFPCHEGRARCLRLEPLDPWSSLNAKDWKIHPNCLQAPRGDVLFLADLRKLLSTIGARLVSEVRDEADRAQVLKSFSEEELVEELRERSKALQNGRGAIDTVLFAQRVLASRRTGAATDDDVPDAPDSTGEPVREIPCNRMVADAGLTVTPCPACRRAWCQTARGRYWVRCQCNMLSQVSDSSIARAVSAWNAVVATLPGPEL